METVIALAVVFMLEFSSVHFLCFCGDEYSM